MGSQTYRGLCLIVVGLPLIPSLNLDEEMFRVKSKNLMVVTINFRNIYNRKDELNSFLTEDNIDIVLGSERHLSPSTNNAEILS